MSEFTDHSAEYLGPNKPVNQTQPVVSVRIITYNHKNYIAQCIQSALMQVTDFPFEVIIGEDDSTDGTREIAMAFAERSKDRIRLILRSKQDKIIIDGAATGRFNFVETIKACRGKYIALLDGDDYWTDPMKLQKQVDFLSQNPEYVLTGHDANIVDAKGKVLRNGTLGKDQKTEFSELELRKTVGMVSSSICFRNVISEFPAEFYKVLNGDVFLMSLLGRHGKGKTLLNIVPGAYRLHGSGMYSSLGAARALNFSINTRIQISGYYARLRDLEMESHFRLEQQQLERIRDNPIRLWLHKTARNTYLFQLHFLGDRPRLTLHAIKRAARQLGTKK